MVKIVKQTTKPLLSKGGVLDRIKPLGPSDKGLKWGFYGRSGTGKTVLACSFPGPFVMICAEDGRRSVSNVKGGECVDLLHSSECTEVSDAAAKTKKWKTVILDTAGSLYGMILKEVLGLDELPVQNSWGMATREQYGQASMQLRERVRRLLDLALVGINVVIIAQEKDISGDDSEVDTSESEIITPTIGFALTKSIVAWLNPECDYLGQTFIRPKMVEKQVKFKIAGKEKIKIVKERAEGVDFCLRVGPHPVYTTKFRAPKGTKLPEVIVDPDYGKLEKYIKGV